MFHKIINLPSGRR